MGMKKRIDKAIDNGIAAIDQLKEKSDFIESVANELAACFRRGNKVIVAGNGGSLCDAAHFAEELTGYFREERKALPAICINDPGHITCVGNDIGFEMIFSRSIEAHGNEGDIFVGLTTSGNSKNLIQAFATAKNRGLTTISFLGRGGGKLKGVADFELSIDGFSYSDRVQEAHMAAIHIIIEMMEELLFYGEEVLHEALASRA